MRVRIDTSGGISKQLIHRVNSGGKCTCAPIKFEWRNDLISSRFTGHGSFVAIAERLAQRAPILVNTDVIHSPAVYCNCGDTLRSSSSGLAQALFQTGKNCPERPVQ